MKCEKIVISVILILILVVSVCVFTACSGGYGQPRVITNTVKVEGEVSVNNDIVATFDSQHYEYVIKQLDTGKYTYSSGLTNTTLVNKITIYKSGLVELTNNNGYIYYISIENYYINVWEKE